jgi:DNA-binding NtrC family response regulator
MQGDGQDHPHIIVADDTEVVRLTVSYLIHRFYPGANLTVVNNGHEALQSHNQHPAALILTDHWMPVMSGVELLQTIRGRRDLTPLIVMSGDASIAPRVTAQHAARFIHKPFAVRQLQEVALALLSPNYRVITWTIPDLQSEC